MGLLGAGKSTLARRLLEDLRPKGSVLLGNEEAVVRCLRRRDDGVICSLLKLFPYPVWEPVAGSRHALAELHAFSCAHPALWALAFELASRATLPSAVRQCILYALYRHGAERQLLDERLRAGEGVLVEEGLAMGLLALLDCLPIDEPCDDVVARYIAAMPASFALVWIDADPAECAARLRQRPGLPLPWAQCTDRELLERLERGRRCLDLAFAACGRRGILCSRISNAAGAAESAAQRLCEQGRGWAERIARLA
jgi:hypothetical protein